MLFTCFLMLLSCFSHARLILLLCFVMFFLMLVEICPYAFPLLFSCCSYVFVLCLSHVLLRFSYAFAIFSYALPMLFSCWSYDVLMLSRCSSNVFLCFLMFSYAIL